MNKEATKERENTAVALSDRRHAVPYLRVLRPEQWIKNGVVLFALLFAYWDPTQRLATCGLPHLLVALSATLLFCLISSGIYILNDICDLKYDRLHPQKCKRPIASGEISVPTAAIEGVILTFIAICSALVLSLPFACILIAYTLMQVAYCLKLKYIPIIDVAIISCGFVMRAIAGAAALQVRISPWLLLCTFLASLFLAFCKRRQEKVTKREDQQRPILKRYSLDLLDRFIAISASLAIAAYMLYTIAPGTVERFSTSWLAITVPFVALGFARYIVLVYKHQKGERPEKVILSDKQLMALIISYLIALAAVQGLFQG